MYVGGDGEGRALITQYYCKGSQVHFIQEHSHERVAKDDVKD